MNSTSSQSRRRGFTLVELLVVIAIIAILAALSISVVNGLMSNARTAATSALLTKIDGRIKDRIQMLAEIDYEQYEFKAVDLGFTNPSVKKLVAKKIVFQEAFPQTWNEVDVYYPDWANQIAQKHGTNTFDARTESAEVLYYLLTEGPVPGKGKRKVISGGGNLVADEFTADDTADIDEDGLLEFVDGWQNPLRFYRWPTRLIRPNGPTGAVGLLNAQILIPSLTANSAAIDADDQLQVFSLDNISEQEASQIESQFHTPNTYQLYLVVSAGPDGKTGLYEPTDTSNFGNLANILVTPGPDGAPGVNGVDDDGDTMTDNNTELGWPGSDDVQDINDNITNRNNTASGT